MADNPFQANPNSADENAPVDENPFSESEKMLTAQPTPNPSTEKSQESHGTATENEPTVEEVKAAEKPVQQAAEKEAENLLDELPTETKSDNSSGDFFFVFKQFLGGLIKTLFGLAVIGLIIWFVWSDGTLTKTISNTQKATQESIETITTNDGWVTRFLNKGAEESEPKQAEPPTTTNTSESDDGFTTKAGNFFQRLLQRDDTNTENPKNPFLKEAISTEEFFENEKKTSTTNYTITSNTSTDTPVSSIAGSNDTSGIRPSSNQDNPMAKAVGFHEWVVEQTNPKAVATGNESSLERAMILLNAQQELFKAPMISYVSGNTLAERTQKVNEFLEYLRGLQQQSADLRQNISAEFDSYSQKANTLRATADASRARINTLLNTGQTGVIDAEIETHIQQRNASYEASANAESRRVIVGRMRNFESSISAVEQNLVANRKALEQDVQVVFSDNDPFRRVLTPEQWRQLRSQ